MRTLDIITQILLIVGGLNWLLIGAFQFDLVATIFGGQTAPLSRLIFIVVGLCAIWQIIRLSSWMDARPYGSTASVPPRDRP
jgi:uncharacterized membrane protein YuzA (DUF378 family)